jgi:hypothetical protein
LPQLSDASKLHTLPGSPDDAFVLQIERRRIFCLGRGPLGVLYAVMHIGRLLRQYGGGSSNFFYNHFGPESREESARIFAAWQAEEPEAVNEGVSGLEGYQKPLVLCIRSQLGRDQHRRWLAEHLRSRPGTKRLLFTFGDWGSVCGDGCPYHRHMQVHERVIDWLSAAAELVRETHPGVKVIGRTWYYDEKLADALIRKTPRGIGIRMKEPAPIELEEPLGHTKYADAWGDVCLYSAKLSRQFGPVYLSGGRLRGEDFYPAVGCGDTEEAVAPVIGMSTPWLTAAKIRRIAENGIRQLALWWGGLHGWCYSVNHEFVAEMIWDPFQDIDVMIHRIAERARVMRPNARFLLPPLAECVQGMEEALQLIELKRIQDEAPAAPEFLNGAAAAAVRNECNNLRILAAVIADEGIQDNVVLTRRRQGKAELGALPEKKILEMEAFLKGERD